MFFFNKYM